MGLDGEGLAFECREVMQDALAPPSAVIRVHVLDWAASDDADPLLGGIDAEEAPILGDGIMGREIGPPNPAHYGI
jgi:hypothetical protein